MCWQPVWLCLHGLQEAAVSSEGQLPESACVTWIEINIHYGHPMQKDIPYSGHVAIHYNDLENQVITEPASFEHEQSHKLHSVLTSGQAQRMPQ